MMKLKIDMGKTSDISQNETDNAMAKQNHMLSEKNKSTKHNTRPLEQTSKWSYMAYVQHQDKGL